MHETTRVGIDDYKEHTWYIFAAKLIAPLLEEGDWDIPAFDNTRNLQLNDQKMRSWLDLRETGFRHELKQVHEELVKALAKRSARLNKYFLKKLRKEAKRLADVLNEDFAEQEMKHENARRATSCSASSWREAGH